MYILIAGLVAAATLLLLPRFLGRRQERMLAQYEVLEKRFGLSRRVSQSRWGKGIGEHFSLHGESCGYQLSLYDHFVKSGKSKTEWTSLVFEVLFAEELEFCIEFPGTNSRACFGEKGEVSAARVLESCSIFAGEELAPIWESDAVAKRLLFLSKQSSSGAVRLSKGFLEYREVGLVEGEEQRLRFQEAILLLASLSDALSLFVSERKAASRTI